jgi:hypothetical protein
MGYLHYLFTASLHGRLQYASHAQPFADRHCLRCACNSYVNTPIPYTPLPFFSIPYCPSFFIPFTSVPYSPPYSIPFTPIPYSPCYIISFPNPFSHSPPPPCILRSSRLPASAG